jgi:exodeoxyribonuclease VII small subunit
MSAKKTLRDDAAQPGFEEALERLETIVEELEGGALSLEESIARYEEGVRLSRTLTRTLDEAEKRIERLVEGAEGPATEPMDLAGAPAPEPPAPPGRADAAPRAPRAATPRRTAPSDDDGRLPF